MFANSIGAAGEAKHKSLVHVDLTESAPSRLRRNPPHCSRRTEITQQRQRERLELELALAGHADAEQLADLLLRQGVEVQG